MIRILAKIVPYILFVSVLTLSIVKIQNWMQYNELKKASAVRLAYKANESNVIESILSEFIEESFKRSDRNVNIAVLANVSDIQFTSCLQSDLSLGEYYRGSKVILLHDDLSSDYRKLRYVLFHEITHAITDSNHLVSIHIMNSNILEINHYDTEDEWQSLLDSLFNYIDLNCPVDY